jgi:hypothetical protein
MTHASVAGSTNEVPSDLVRLSVGLETAGDLVEDLRQALDSVDRSSVRTGSRKGSGRWSKKVIVDSGSE